MKKPSFVNEGIYHVYNRGVEKRAIFLDDHDYFRFLYGLHEFNDKHPAYNSYYKESSPELYEAKPRKEYILKDREQIVHIFAFTLMDNHFHLFLQQIQDDGIVRFMHKLGTGYTGFFNKKYDRVGHLFQGPFKAVLVEKESQLLYLPHYIHSNPLDLTFPFWREKGIGDSIQAEHILEGYPYSSYSAYTGKNDLSFILEKEFLSKILGGPEQHKKDMQKWLAERSPTDGIENIVLK
ncbi:hypothetical protein A2755_00760 [Candidatus Wolfebacteria bacterium RIFCSPHIGHO2_01_FULL_48_22]|uniref:Transposase IS200-like domain-containing protein n=2 Tax=Candidatus Wolfeibacteriota TaxID=1752735 RepID=A0A1F8DTD8_9BACT|nr:MAG: hypothetical protein A2755_00760 [Candidatus Wolfebacteria bacterium RIFCSPHIGHO2_01_FULL_48_22]OGM93546.1 MAG: hypothetical protein A2935_02870 [Candidatus Wolfebacteria bacterium RIFCSPLOWO2_01_FULL_47_17b]